MVDSDRPVAAAVSLTVRASSAMMGHASF